MRAISTTLAAAALALLAGGPAWAGASVTFVEPDKFIDLPFSPVERERVLKDLNDYVVKLGARLPAGQNLKIEVTEVDLAGRLELSRRTSHDIRVLTGGADWPRIDLRYQLEADGKVLRSGDEHLTDMNYLQRLQLPSSTETLRYEKRMLDEWFVKTFGVPARGAPRPVAAVNPAS